MLSSEDLEITETTGTHGVDSIMTETEDLMIQCSTTPEISQMSVLVCSICSI